MSGTVERAAIIEQLRTELAEAARAGFGDEFRFEIGPIELELTVAVSKEVGQHHPLALS